MSTELIAENRSRSVDTLPGNEELVTDEKGDVTRPKSAGVRKKKKPGDKLQKEEEKASSDLLEAQSPFRTVSERTPLMDLNGLLHITPEPLPPLKNLQTSQGQVSVIADQVNRMKKDLAKLQQIAEEYKCMEKYKADIDFLVDNVKDAITE